MSCNTIKPVVVSSVGNFRMENKSTNPELRFDIGLHNPNNYGVTILKMEIGLSVGDSVISRISMLESTRLKRHEEISTVVAFNPSLENITSVFKAGMNQLFSGKKQPPITVKGEILIKKFIFRKKYKIQKSVNM